MLSWASIFEDHMARILLTTIGSSGDVHPFIAIGVALKALGHEPILGVPSDFVEKCRTAGLPAHSIFPDYQTLADNMEQDAGTIVRGVMRSPDYLVRQILLPNLASATEKIDAIAEGVDLIISSMFVFGAPIIAQKRKIPIVPVILQPIGILSAVAPSFIPDVPIFARGQVGALGQTWNKMLIAIMRGEMLRRCQRALDHVHQEHGLMPARSVPLFEFEGHVPFQLATYDPAFAQVPADAPLNTHQTGFSHFDSGSGAPETLSAPLTQFLDQGPPPIVFTLGSFAVYAPGNFYEESVKAARLLTQRAVLLIGPEGPLPSNLSSDVCVVEYAPHSLLFPRASVIVHHGGIGTTGQALMAGKPQLVVPFLGDQPDNAQRIVALGVGLQLSSKAYKSFRAAKRMATLLDDATVKPCAGLLSQQMITDGAMCAARIVDEFMQKRLT